MEKRINYSILLSPSEAKRIKAVALASGETMSGYIRRQMLMVCDEEESQK